MLRQLREAALLITQVTARARAARPCIRLVILNTANIFLHNSINLINNKRAWCSFAVTWKWYRCSRLNIILNIVGDGAFLWITFWTDLWHNWCCPIHLRCNRPGDTDTNFCARILNFTKLRCWFWRNEPVTRRLQGIHRRRVQVCAVLSSQVLVYLITLCQCYWYKVIHRRSAE